MRPVLFRGRVTSSPSAAGGQQLPRQLAEQFRLRRVWEDRLAPDSVSLASRQPDHALGLGLPRTDQ